MRSPARLGEIIQLTGRVDYVGDSTIGVRVDGHKLQPKDDPKPVVTGTFLFCTVDEEGKAVAHGLPEIKPVTEAARRRWATEDRSLPIFAEFDRIADRIRLEAYNLFARRGSGDGGALDDWLEAERNVCWPAAKLVERDGAFVLEVALAGFEPSEISLTATPREKSTATTESASPAFLGPASW